MNHRATILAILLLALGLAAQAPAPDGGQVVDRIAAVVDGQPVMQSEVEDAAWFARLSERWAHPAAPVASAGLSPAELQAALSHLMDEQLLDEARDSEGYGLVPDAAVEAQWTRLRAQAGGAAALAGQLRAYHLDPPTVTALLRRQLTLVAFLDQHFSGSIAVSDEQVESYYQTVFVPQARQRQLAPAALSAVRSTIVAILRQQQLNAAEQQWLAQLRGDARIERKERE